MLELIPALLACPLYAQLFSRTFLCSVVMRSPCAGVALNPPFGIVPNKALSLPPLSLSLSLSLSPCVSGTCVGSFVVLFEEFGCRESAGHSENQWFYCNLPQDQIVRKCLNLDSAAWLLLIIT